MILDLKAPTLADRPWVMELLQDSPHMGTLYAFGTIYLWAEAYNTRICRYKDTLLIRGGQGCRYFGFPNGVYDLREIIPILSDDARSRGCPLILSPVEEHQKDELLAAFPDRFDVEENRNEYDYVYDINELAALSGSRYHGKRNHIAKLTRAYPDWVCEPITAANAAECVAMEAEWCAEYAGDEGGSIHAEQEIITRALREMEQLELFGALIRINGKVIAFTIGERLNADTIDVHFEKALTEYREAYALINREFCAMNAGRFSYVNREEDMGLDGLRQAKLSYHPSLLVKKYTITER